MAVTAKGRRRPPKEAPRNVLFRLKQTLERLGVTEAQAAERAKIDPSKLNKWCRGVAFPSWPNACKLADVLGVAVDAFR